MFILKALLALFVGTLCQSQNDFSFTTPQILNEWGFPAETHYVTTEDGYILALHRIPAQNSTSKTVFLQHGILCSSDDWVVLGPGNSIALLLADAGYDVWFGNSRGNTYSRNHTALSPDNPRFWDFSWHELGIYDLPASIDYILQQTGQEQLDYIGHSQGTTAFYVMASERPDYNSKIHVQISLAAVYDLSKTTNPLLQILGLLWNEGANDVVNTIGPFETLPHTSISTDLIAPFCQHPIGGQICQGFLFLLFGISPNEANIPIMPDVFAHYPAGASSKQFIHYLQITNSKQFRQYDYGLAENLLRYGSTSPPNYNISDITTPIYIFWASNDQLATQAGVNNLYASLDDSRKLIHVNDKFFNHADFIYGSHVNELVYTQILYILANIN